MYLSLFFQLTGTKILIVLVKFEIVELGFSTLLFLLYIYIFFGITIEECLYTSPLLLEIVWEFSIILERFSLPLLKLETFLVIFSNLVLRLA